MRTTEIQFVEGLRRRAERQARRLGGASDLRRGIGDDCAVIAPSAGSELLITTDLFAEDVHFRRRWREPRSAGHKALARGLSDIAAMGGLARYAFLSLCLPRAWKPDWMEAFWSGFFDLAASAKVVLAGGDTGSSPTGFVADVIVVGEAPRGSSILRSGARIGDEIWVTGGLGLAAAGLAVLERPGVRKTGKIQTEALEAFLYPQPRLRIGRLLRERRLASAMIDLSDGLSIDLARLCQASGVGARIFAEAIPLQNTADSRSAGTRLRRALHGGEDLELLFTVPRSKSAALPRSIAGVRLTRIGHIIPAKRGNRNLLLMQGSKETALPVLGFQHF